MGDDLGNLRPSDTVLLCFLQVIGERSVGQTLADESCDGDKAAVTKTEKVVAASNLAKQDVVVEMGKLRGKLSKLCAACRLYYFLLCHYIKC